MNLNRFLASIRKWRPQPGDVLVYREDVTSEWSGGEAFTPESASETGAGDVVGPASSTDGALVAFDGTDGKAVKEASTANLRLTGPVGIGTSAPASGLAVAGPIVGDAKIGATATMAGNVVLDATSDDYLLYDPNGSDRNVTLWTPGAGRTPARVIKHDGAANNIVVKNPAAATLVTLTTTNPVCTVAWNGTAWKVF